MSQEKTSPLRQMAVRIAWPLSVVVAFGLGAALMSGESGENSPSHGDHASHPGAGTQTWTCAMHPQIRSPESGLCPICAMDLVPVAEGESDRGARPERVSLSDAARIKARIRTAPVERLATGTMERRLLGKVEYDETRLRTVTSWIGGRIDRLHVRATGQKVWRGQVIATLYSPEIFSAHQDLLVAKQQIAKLAGATEIARNGALAVLEAARDRLRLAGVPDGEIAAMEKANRPSEQVRIRAPVGGTVIERMATEGSYVKTGSGLYQVVDLSRVWVQLDAYQSDLPLLDIGQQVTLEVEALPGQDLEGRVTFVDPVLDQRTRTTRVRIEVKNPHGKLRPGMFAEAVVRAARSTEPALVIPDSAPLFTGRRSIVYVEVPNAERPTYESRVVRLGPQMGTSYPVISGLGEGERVVIYGAFTLDADLQIRGGRSMMSAPDDTSDEPGDDIIEVPEKHREPLAGVIRHYLALQEALAGDDLDTALAASAAVGKAAASLQPSTPAQLREAWMPIRRQVLAHTEHLGRAKSLDDARVPFRDISQQIATVLRVFGNPTGETVRLASCPMALSGAGAEWVQRSNEIENPYYGASMHRCGSVHNVIEHGTYLPLGDAKDTAGQPAPKGGHQH